MKENDFSGLYQYLAEISYEDLPDSIVDKVKLCLMDTIGIIIGAQSVGIGKKIVKLSSEVFGISSEGSAVIGTEKIVSPQYAAFINGSLAEVLEMQDGIRYGGIHPSSTVIPAVLALAQRRGFSGKKLILSIFAGYEFLGRLTRLVYPQPLYRGFNMTGVCGGFGAAMGCSKLLGFNEESMANAMGVCAMYSPISSRASFFHEVKPTHAGKASETGLLSALITENGVKGSREVLETEDLGGICTSLIAECREFDQVSKSLGEHFEVDELYFKPFPSCRHTHGSVHAVLELMKDNEFSAENVEKIEVETYDVANIAVGKRRPDLRSVDCQRQFSIPYVVSACLISGRFTVEEMFGTRSQEQKVYDFMPKVHVRVSSEINEHYPEFTATKVKIFLKNGEKYSKLIKLPKGDPRNPLSKEELEDKFKGLVSRILNHKETERLYADIWELESLQDVSEFILNIGRYDSK
ncbi:MAG: MmgE/PrpD family protein [Desulfobacteraceae bacterium]|nr:MmgE/PrpD family protein [Desulfobacteraceae bacterium]